MDIKGNVFVVTGGGAGIGREIVLSILRQGGIVASCDINLEGLKETSKLAGDLAENLSIHKVDISNLEEIKTFKQAVLKTHKKVDGLINNAGIIQPFIKVTDIEIEYVQKVFNVNFFGSLYLIKEFLPTFLENKTKASIINISSMAGFIPFPRQAIYGASKAALKILTEALYAELKDTNVHVGVVLPGGVATDIAKNSNLNLETGKKQSTYKMLSPQECADIVVNAIKKEKFKTLAGKDVKTMDKLYRINSKMAVDMLVKNTKNLFID